MRTALLLWLSRKKILVPAFSRMLTSTVSGTLSI